MCAADRDIHQGIVPLPAHIAGPRPTDALRAHRFATPLMARLAEMATPVEGTVNIVLDEGAFHILISAAGPAYGRGLAEHPDHQRK
jgi:hypothetical protein